MSRILSPFAPQCLVDADNDEQTTTRRSRSTPAELDRRRHCALDSLWPMVYDDVRRLARRQMACERGDHTLQAPRWSTKHSSGFPGHRVFQWQNREQFLSLAAQIMRRVLVDYARQRGAQRRGDGARKVSLYDTQAAIEVDAAQALDALNDERVDVLAIDSALTQLQQIDAPQSRIVELRYFGGLTSRTRSPWASHGTRACRRSWRTRRRSRLIADVPIFRRAGVSSPGRFSPGAAARASRRSWLGRASSLSDHAVVFDAQHRTGDRAAHAHRERQGALRRGASTRKLADAADEAQSALGDFADLVVSAVDRRAWRRW